MVDAPPQDQIYEAVAPFDAELLHVNVAHRTQTEREAFTDEFAMAALGASSAMVTKRLAQADWRCRLLVASWTVAVRRLRQFVPGIVELLTAADLVYASQGYCVALASLPDETGLAPLAAYLNRLVAGGDRYHDQPWIMTTLIHVDHELGTSVSSEFLRADGAWVR
jgi:hypothetical protein